jgi:hypothetical protein
VGSRLFYCQDGQLSEGYRIGRYLEGQSLSGAGMWKEGATIYLRLVEGATIMLGGKFRPIQRKGGSYM